MYEQTVMFSSFVRMHRKDLCTWMDNQCVFDHIKYILIIENRILKIVIKNVEARSRQNPWFAVLNIKQAPEQQFLQVKTYHGSKMATPNTLTHICHATINRFIGCLLKKLYYVTKRHMTRYPTITIPIDKKELIRFTADLLAK